MSGWLGARGEAGVGRGQGVRGHGRRYLNLQVVRRKTTERRVVGYAEK